MASGRSVQSNKTLLGWAAGPCGCCSLRKSPQKSRLGEGCEDDCSLVLLGSSCLRKPSSFNGYSSKSRHPSHCLDPIWAVFIPRMGFLSSEISLERTNERWLRSKQPLVTHWGIEQLACGQTPRTGYSHDLNNRSEGGVKCGVLTWQVHCPCLFLSTQISDTFSRRQGVYKFAYFSMNLRLWWVQHTWILCPVTLAV